MTITKNREYRAEIARQTLSVIEQGSYQNLRGDLVSIATDLQFAKVNSIHYSSELLAELLSAATGQNGFATRFEVTNESTLAAARRHLDNGVEDPLCLNFASAKNPGGGFLGGSEAQEENLTKSSGLYPCIAQMHAMYNNNRANKSSAYNDDMIYSPKVPVFRDDAYAVLDKAFLVSMVTAPAVNRGAVTRNEPGLVDQLAAIMCLRIDKLLSLALHHKHKALILGAWGCGVFGNRAQDMANWFAVHLLHNQRYCGAFELVSFAVLDRKNDGTYDAFNSVFGERRNTSTRF